MKIQVAGFWVVTPCSDVAVYQRFLQFSEVNVYRKGGIEIGRKTSVFYHTTVQCHIPEDRDFFQQQFSAG